jgi:hypothetical protein
MIVRVREKDDDLGIRVNEVYRAKLNMETRMIHILTRLSDNKKVGKDVARKKIDIIGGGYGGL